jgi:hypothetical protein
MATLMVMSRASHVAGPAWPRRRPVAVVAKVVARAAVGAAVVAVHDRAA